MKCFIVRNRNSLIYALAFLLTVMIFSGCQFVKPSEKGIQLQENKKFAESIEYINFNNDRYRTVKIRFRDNHSETLMQTGSGDESFDYYFRDREDDLDLRAQIKCIDSKEICKVFTIVVEDRDQKRSAEIYQYKYSSNSTEDRIQVDSNGATNPQELSMAMDADMRDTSAVINVDTYLQRSAILDNQKPYLTAEIELKNWSVRFTDDPFADPAINSGASKFIKIFSPTGVNKKAKVIREFKQGDGTPFADVDGDYVVDVKINMEDSEEGFLSYDIYFDKADDSSNKPLKLKKICVNNLDSRCEADRQ